MIMIFKLINLATFSTVLDFRLKLYFHKTGFMSYRASKMINIGTLKMTLSIKYWRDAINVPCIIYYKLGKMLIISDPGNEQFSTRIHKLSARCKFHQFANYVHL